MEQVDLETFNKIQKELDEKRKAKMIEDLEESLDKDNDQFEY